MTLTSDRKPEEGNTAVLAINVGLPQPLLGRSVKC